MAVKPPVTWVRRYRQRLLEWYRRHHRRLPWRESGDPFAIWVSEVMLQQTQVKTVQPYYQRFLARFPDVVSLSRADMQTVLKLWEGLGYYSRARHLHTAAKIVVADHRGRVPDDPQAFRSLPGVGPYICAAVMSIAFNWPLAVVDGNVKRVFARLLVLGEPVNRPGSHRVFQDTADQLLYRSAPGTYNQAVMELGALICRPRQPLCADCPVAALCIARSSGRVAVYPVREKRPQPPLKRLAAGLVWRGDRILIAQRPPGGLLAGMWEFPGGPIATAESPEDACRRGIRESTGAQVSVSAYIGQIRHAYTHFRVAYEVFECRYRSGTLRPNGPVGVEWVPWSALQNRPMPKAHHKIMARVDGTAPPRSRRQRPTKGNG